ncbi:MAG: hypothetical protein H5T86_04255 [Armatimonadetes bacterium]|nr:hypothetical protein [Armatimonadota bacterium]
MTETQFLQDVISAVDAGASRCRCAVVDASAKVLAVSSGPGAAFSLSAPDASIEVIRRCVLEAADRAGVELPLDGLSLGVAGIGREPERQVFAERMRSLGLARRIVATHDAEIALWGAVPSGEGAVVIAGTGAIAVGRSRTGAQARAGGWGREIDDEGGAWWLGARVLAAVLRAHDGRGPETALTGAVLQTTGCSHPEQLITWLRSSGRSPRDVAELALLADRAAAAGDEVAIKLLDEAAGALAEMATACVRRLGPDSPKEIALLGGLFASSAYLRRRFCRAVAAALPDVRIVQPRLPPIFGAVINYWRQSGREVRDELIQALEGQISVLPEDWGYERQR